MERDEISNMEAGPKMDVLVIREVLKLEIVDLHRDASGTPYCRRWSVLRGNEDFYLIDYPGWAEYVPFCPSTDIAAASLVMGKMEEDDWWWQAANVVPNSDPIVYEWVFTRQGKKGYACEYTIPAAICKAALLAKLESET